MEKVTRLNPKGSPGAFLSQTWLHEKIDETVIGLARAADDLRRQGADPRALSPALWNALKVFEWAHGFGFSPENVEAIVGGGEAKARDILGLRENDR